MEIFNIYLVKIVLTLVIICMPRSEGLGSGPTETVYDVVSPDFGIDYSPSVVNCEAECMKTLQSSLPKKSNGVINLPCTNYTSLISEHILCTTTCGYPRIRNVGQCLQVVSQISNILELNETQLLGCSPCNNTTKFPTLSFDLSARAQCIDSCSSWVDILNKYAQITETETVCDGFISDVKSSKACHKPCRVPFLRNVSECEKYFEFDTVCNVCTDIFPDIGSGIMIFGGVSLALLVGICFLSDLIKDVSKRKKKNHRNSTTLTDFHYEL